MSPYFHNMTEFLAMGKYGAYVWTCYGLTCLAIIGLIFYSTHQRKSIYKDIFSQRARQNQRRNRTTPHNSTTDP